MFEWWLSLSQPMSVCLEEISTYMNFCRILHLPSARRAEALETDPGNFRINLDSCSHPRHFYSEDQRPLFQPDCVWCLIPTSLLGILPECECMRERSTWRDLFQLQEHSSLWFDFPFLRVNFAIEQFSQWSMSRKRGASVVVVRFPQRFSGQIIQIRKLKVHGV